MHLYSLFLGVLNAYVLIVDTRELLKGESEGLLKLPSDTALLDDPEFRKFVELYAKVIWACLVLFYC